MRDRVVPAADVITPNHFELDFLAGRTTRTVAEVLGPRSTPCASAAPPPCWSPACSPRRRPRARSTSWRSRDAGAWTVRTPLLPISPNGCGDVTAAVFLAHLLRTGSAATALQRVTSTVFGILERTIEAGTREIQLVAAQDVIADPPDRFAPDRGSR